MRSRSAPASEGLPIVAVNEVEPGVTVTGYCCCAPFAMVGRWIDALPKLPPVNRPVNPPSVLLTVYWRLTGTRAVADAMSSGLGVIVAPSTAALSDHGATSTSDVRRASTMISQTPGIGLTTVRLVGVPPAQPAPAPGL